MNNKLKKNCSLLMLIFFFTCMFNVNVLAANFTSYKIKYGDTLYKIAVNYKTSVSNLAKINNVKNPNRIYAGQTIKVPVKNNTINKGEINKKPNKPQNTVSKDNLKKIDILSLDALHGRLEKDENTIGIAKTSAYINHYRNNNLKGTLLLDAGNALQGTVLSTATHGKPVVDVYNTMKLDAMTVGNHEFDWGTKKLAETMKDAKFPLVSCNIYGNDGKRVPWTKPYVMINKNGVNVAIIGVLNPKHKEAIAANVMKEVQFKDAVTEVNALVPEVRKNGADVVIVLANIGGITDSKTNVCKGDLIDFSKALKNVDAVVGSLHNIVCTKINGMPVVEAFRYGEKLGHITLNYDINKKKVVNSSVEILDVKDGKLNLKEDTNVQAVVDKYAKDLKAYNDTVIGKTDKDLKRAKGENPIGNWSADSMRESVNAQIAFTNPGGLRADINAGNITIGDVFKVMPFPNTIVTGKMTGKQVREFLEQCAQVGIIPISGIKFEFDSSKEVGHRVVKATLSDGKDIKDDEVYKVATNSFLGGGKDGYTSLAKITWTDTKILIRDAMLDNVKKNNGIKDTVEGRSMNIKVVGYKPTTFFMYS